MLHVTWTLTSVAGMKFLVAIALLAFAVAEAHHTPYHTLRGPRFKTNTLYKYDVEFNVTSGVLGLRSQVSKTALKAEVSIYAKTEKKHFLRIEKVFTSGAVEAVHSKDGYIPMQRNTELEDRLSVPISFTLEKGEVTSYTLDRKDDLISKKIKKSILRSLEMYVSQSAIEEVEYHKGLPITYNVTKETEYGVHATHYMINVSPNPNFPTPLDVFNITRWEDYEGETYPSYLTFENFRKKGCSEVCRRDWENNTYGAGCPVGYEPHHGPIKVSLSQEHHYSLNDRIMTPEIIRTTEAHVASMYDQDMEVLITYELKRTAINHKERIEEPSRQQTYSDLSDYESEINEKEIDAICSYKTSREAIESVKTLLKDISRYVVANNLEDRESSRLGERIILLKNALMKLSAPELKEIKEREITTKRGLSRATDEEKAKRQIWLDILPLVGTEQSVDFLVDYIKESAISDLMVWEIKEMLEALPQNIHTPSERIIRKLKSLIEGGRTRDVIEKNHLLHSAVHMTLVRVIGRLCGITAVPSRAPTQQSPSHSSWFSSYHAAQSPEQHASSPYASRECPERLVTEIVQQMIESLKRSQKKEDIIIYLEALSHIGAPEVLHVIAEYAYGIADNIQRYTPKYIDFVKTVSLYSLHNMIPVQPKEVLSVVLPIYFNETEIARVRSAAFGVLIRCHPSLSILQRIAMHSWSEKSTEVGSYVTSTLETFGNSTYPCMQLTTERIKKVLPQLRRFDIGLHHSKNYLWSYFDDEREFGLEKRLEYTASNESIIPSALYHSLSYSMGSLTDTIGQMALNIEGLTQEKIMRSIESYLGIKDVPHFTKRQEEEIFGEAKLQPRLPDYLRYTTYRRVFYSSSYNYFESDTENVIKKHFSEYVMTYLMPSDLKVEGVLVKLFLPSTYHTKSIAKTLPYPVEFTVNQPVVFALHVKSLNRAPTLRRFHVHLRPSIYATKLYTNQLKNIGDCKEVGVYHEDKIAVVYPFEVQFEVIDFSNMTVKYKVPELGNRKLMYLSESGTYAGKKELETLPSTANRVPIRTLPSPFKIEKEINLVGLPPFRVELHTEDIGLFTKELPRNPQEALDIVVRRVLNAGWRYKSINLTVLEDYRKWPKDTEVTVGIQYYRDHMTSDRLRMYSKQYSPSNMAAPQWFNRQDPEEDQWKSEWTTESDQWQSEWTTESDQWKSEWTTESDEPDDWNKKSSKSWSWKKPQYAEEEEEDWSKYLIPTDVTYTKDPITFIEQGKRVSTKLSTQIPHITHGLKVQVETKPVYSSALFTVEYNYTYTKSLQTFHVNAVVKPPTEESYNMSLDHLMAFWNKPNECKYDSHKQTQLAVSLTAFSQEADIDTCPWERVEAIVKGVYKYESLEELLKNELAERIDSNYYLPESHEECLRDVENGKALSTECLKAIRERSIYNKWYMTLLWQKLPESLRKLARRVDIYTKHYLFHHMNLTDELNTENKISIRMNYIDKFTDEPVFDVKLEKPTETVEFRRVPTGGLQPLSSVYSVVETSLMELTNNTYPPSCVMMKNYVRTYDMDTYQFSPESCSYVLTSHCSEYKYFAVIVKGLDTSRGTKEVHIYVGNDVVILTPRRGGEYTVKFNNKQHQIREPILLDDTDSEVYAYTEKYNDDVDLHVRARKAGIRVQYDGVNIKVQVDPRYKGELCGLCSEFDGEILREYRGLDRCLYSHPIDFANTAITRYEGHCKKSSLLGQKLCEDSDESREDWSDSYAPKTPKIRRNMVVSKGNEYCFSTLPVPVCEDNAKPIETETQTLAFHCLPKRDVTAKKLLTESKRRVLGEIAYKSTDFEEPVEVAKKC